MLSIFKTLIFPKKNHAIKTLLLCYVLISPVVVLSVQPSGENSTSLYKKKTEAINKDNAKYYLDLAIWCKGKTGEPSTAIDVYIPDKDSFCPYAGSGIGTVFHEIVPEVYYLDCNKDKRK